MTNSSSGSDNTPTSDWDCPTCTPVHLANKRLRAEIAELREADDNAAKLFRLLRPRLAALESCFEEAWNYRNGDHDGTALDHALNAVNKLKR